MKVDRSKINVDQMLAKIGQHEFKDSSLETAHTVLGYLQKDLIELDKYRSAAIQTVDVAKETEKELNEQAYGTLKSRLEVSLQQIPWHQIQARYSVKKSLKWLENNRNYAHFFHVQLKRKQHSDLVEAIGTMDLKKLSLEIFNSGR